MEKSGCSTGATSEVINPERLLKDEYQWQHYDFSTTLFMSEFEAEVKRQIKIALTDLEIQLCQVLGQVSKEDNIIVKESMESLYTSYIENLKGTLQKVEAEFSKTFDIPDNVVLEEDIIKSQAVSNNDLENLEKEVADLEKTLIQEKLFLARCQNAKNYYDSHMAPYRKKINELRELKITEDAPKITEKSSEILQLFNHKAKKFVEAREDSDSDFAVGIQTLGLQAASFKHKNFD